MDAAPSTMRIGELADRTGVSVRSLRYYDELGLVPSVRDANGYRRFSVDAVSRVRHVQLLYAAGLCSSKVAEVLRFVDGDEHHVSVSAELADELVAAKRRLDAQIDDLRAATTVLERLLAAGRTGAPVPVDARRPRRPARGSLGTRVHPPSAHRSTGSGPDLHPQDLAATL